MLRALIFDVDGTLVDTECNGHRVAYNRSFEESGLDWHWSKKEYGNLLSITGGKERLRHYLETRVTPDERSELPSPERLVDELYQKKTGHFVSLAETGRLLPRPGVYRIIAEAQKAGLTLAIASSTDERNVRALLRCSFDENIEYWFETIAAGDTVDNKKPAPDIYRKVLDTLNLDAEQCLAFEDSAAGLRAARALGIPSIVTWNEYTRSDDFSDAALVIEHLDRPCDPGLHGVAKRNPAPEKPLDLEALTRIHAASLGLSAAR